jgi:hypothetical protein
MIFEGSLKHSFLTIREIAILIVPVNISKPQWALAVTIRIEPNRLYSSSAQP